ncbi:MAG: DinB family protein [Terriglobales bacterium]
MTEAAHIAEQLRNAFHGNAWHGPGLLELLADIDAATAAAHPLPDVHSIWELLLHIAAWDDAVNRRIVSRKALQLNDAGNFPPVQDESHAAWKKTIAHAKKTHAVLLKTVKALPDRRLTERVPGKKYDIRFMLHGVAQHEVYHAGQIAILTKTLL